MPAFQRHFGPVILVALQLAGCGHMPVTSMVKLARVDLASSEPAELRAALRLPQAIRPMHNQVHLKIAARLANGWEERQDFRLSEIVDPAERALLRDEVEPGTHLFAYRLDASEVARLTAFREEIKRQQAASGRRGGAVTISVEPAACRSSELPPGAVLFTTYLRTAETGSYVPLARDLDLREVVPGRDLAAEMPLCGSSG